MEPRETAVKKMEIYDMNGRMLIRKNVETESRVFSIATSSLLNGNYILKIFYKNSTKTFKILKE
jgi:hypothetical protein